MRIFNFLSCLILLSLSSCSVKVVGTSNTSSGRIAIVSKEAPQPIGPYSQAIAANGFLFISGQVGSNVKTGKLVTDSFEAEATQVMENLKAILKQSGIGFDQVVKTTIYLKDINQFAAVNKIYGQYFTANPPARETVQVANLPGSANIEISMTAVLK